MKEDVNVFVSQCNTCEANKTPQKLPRAPLGLMNVGAPLDRLGVDIMGPLNYQRPLEEINIYYLLLTISQNGLKYLLCLTKPLLLVPKKY